MNGSIACVALGSNLGEPAATLHKAAIRMHGIIPGVRLAARSRLWLTAPQELEPMPVVLPEVLRAWLDGKDAGRRGRGSGPAPAGYCGGVAGAGEGNASSPPSPPLAPPSAPPSSPWYANMAVRLECGPEVTPESLFEALMRLEAELGRNRLMERRWGPRLIDIDLLTFGDQTRDTPRLTLPHPRMFERAFVLLPLAEVAPEVIPPEKSQGLSFASSGTMLL